MDLLNMNAKTADVAASIPQVENTKTPDPVDVPTAMSDASVNKPEVKETVSESPKAVASSGIRHVVMYLAGGIWCDHEGQYWCRDKKGNCIQAKTFTDAEYQKREDIKFMVEYGAMKDTISE